MLCRATAFFHHELWCVGQILQVVSKLFQLSWEHAISLRPKYIMLKQQVKKLSFLQQCYTARERMLTFQSAAPHKSIHITNNQFSILPAIANFANTAIIILRHTIWYCLRLNSRRYYSTIQDANVVHWWGTSYSTMVQN